MSSQNDWQTGILSRQMVILARDGLFINCYFEPLTKKLDLQVLPANFSAIPLE